MLHSLFAGDVIARPDQCSGMTPDPVAERAACWDRIVLRAGQGRLGVGQRVSFLNGGFVDFELGCEAFDLGVAGF